MSKIGRKPIPVSTATVTIKDSNISIKGSNGSFEHVLPKSLNAKLEDGKLTLSVSKNGSREAAMVWGLNRALLANMIKGVETGFETNIKIVGLGYKAQLSGSKLTFTLGFSHKIDFAVPKGVEVVVDRSGQNLTVKSADKSILGKTCDAIRSLRPVEPYKGTGVIIEGEIVRRKAGKAKSKIKQGRKNLKLNKYEILRLRKEGKTLHQIGEQIRCSYGTIYNLLNGSDFQNNHI